MDITLFEFAPLYIPTDIRKLILSFSIPIHAYIGCVIKEQDDRRRRSASDRIHVLGVCRTLLQASKICLDHKNSKIRFESPRYHILTMKEGDVFPNKINSRLLYPPQIPLKSSVLYHTIGTVPFNRFCSFCMETFKKDSLVVRLPCNHVFHSIGIRTWMENTLHCPLCRKIVRPGNPSPLEAGEVVYIDEGNPYVLGIGGERRFVLSLSGTSQKNIDFYNIIESTWKIKFHPQGGGIPHPFKFFVQ